MIRPLTIEELPLAMPLARAFALEQQRVGGFDDARALATWTRFLHSGSGDLIGLWQEGRLVGMIGCMVYDDLYDGLPVGQQMLWYVSPEARRGTDAIRLLDAFEDWCDLKMARRRVVGRASYNHTDGLGKWYARHGYRDREIFSVKELTYA
jgi:hypothetical protein